MQFNFRIPEKMPTMSIKELLEDYFLIPRKIRHFLRTKKHVLVNDQTINWQSKIQAGDLLSLTFDEEDYPAKAILMGKPELVQELYQDQHLIIVNKPEGMKTHANEPTELALLNHVSAYVGETCYVVHRLDKETSGAVLFAKNPFVLPILNRLLEIYKDKIGRDRHNRRKRLVDNKHGQYAETHVTRLKSFGQKTLVKCQLKTGRTHQIRVHLSHHGFPLVGDPLYHPQPQGRLMLHAYRLSFVHPFTLEKISLEAPSKSFEEGLEKLKA